MGHGADTGELGVGAVDSLTDAIWRWRLCDLSFLDYPGPPLTIFFFFFNDPGPPEISTLPLHAALPISSPTPPSRLPVSSSSPGSCAWAAPPSAAPPRPPPPTPPPPPPAATAWTPTTTSSSAPPGR